ncbi:hypothetical protein [Carboxylicivirga marina]|uniref:hypothetical protein n=1 Tax=Carboxylicivirga marina TaxID=2800988 RepID=UPI0025982E9B|nr:hypothetical protein [uncultured Carboxylicivirga sp.]
MNLKLSFKQFLDWKKRLEEKTDRELIKLYSETDRINLEPQIYAGQILIRRNYNKTELKRIKDTLIQSIKEKSERKYGKNESEIKRENTIKLIFFRIIGGIGFFLGLKALLTLGHLFPDFQFRELMPYIGFTLSFAPLLNLKKLNEAEISNIDKKKLKFVADIEKINNKLII